ncbi:AAA domain-containing protein [Actinopolymorpha sp. B9G3]|uniref:DEAD/DEAH box helicase n=1 Tax=Actinopolymorpha sp. B9G3 TaxID=3158970 RepID=UPI0032D902A3
MRQHEHERSVGLRREHRQFQPGFWEWLTTLGRSMREWRRRDSELASEVSAAERALSAVLGDMSQLAHDVQSAEHSVDQAEATLRRCERDFAAVDDVIEQARHKLGPQFPDERWRQDRTERELCALWTDAEWNRARTELFLQALQLHRAFLEHMPVKMRQSLHGVADILDGQAPDNLPKGAALAAWQALFFIVPVVSTTFASFARLFSHLKQEDLGWLFVDEAGQAVPQGAVGALWRSRRAVVLGDPLQLEPIVDLPFRAEQAIRRNHGVGEEWLTSRSSVQRLADRLNDLGTWLPGDDKRIWVGAPLTVHRRCGRPMFGIVNDMAYEGLMIDGTSSVWEDHFREDYPTLPESKWIDVASSRGQGHWRHDEGRQLDRILRTLAALDFDMTEVLVIGPFRDVAQRIREHCRRYPGVVAGTIHTAQGRQAEIVVLVLGSDPQRPGARRWAASRPNLLNVAVSRAKRRLYVIGDREAWRHERYFSVLAHRLPHATPITHT